METVSRCMDSLAFWMTLPESAINWLAWPALSAFCLVIEDISSSEEEVSSMEAACSLVPSASCWDEADTCSAAEDTSLDPASKPLMMRWIGRVMERVTAQAIPAPIRTPNPNARTITQLEVETMDRVTAFISSERFHASF
jgi:hypothetical protein